MKSLRFVSSFIFSILFILGACTPDTKKAENAQKALNDDLSTESAAYSKVSNQTRETRGEKALSLIKSWDSSLKNVVRSYNDAKSKLDKALSNEDADATEIEALNNGANQAQIKIESLVSSRSVTEFKVAAWQMKQAQSSKNSINNSLNDLAAKVGTNNANIITVVEDQDLLDTRRACMDVFNNTRGVDIDIPETEIEDALEGISKGSYRISTTSCETAVLTNCGYQMDINCLKANIQNYYGKAQTEFARAEVNHENQVKAYKKYRKELSKYNIAKETYDRDKELYEYKYQEWREGYDAADSISKENYPRPPQEPTAPIKPKKVKKPAKEAPEFCQSSETWTADLIKKCVSKTAVFN